jgi:hypothetical protein
MRLVISTFVSHYETKVIGQNNKYIVINCILIEFDALLIPRLQSIQTFKLLILLL